MKTFDAENINREKKYIFIHIPKNAGTSISYSLNMKQSGHWTAQEYRSCLGDSFNQMFKFCITRNPWDRFLSLYNYARLESSFHHSTLTPELATWGKHPDYDLVSTLSIEECALHLVNRGFEKSHSIHWYPQVYWINDKNGKPIVDYCGRFEKLNESMSYISEMLKMPLNHLRLNSSNLDNNCYRDMLNTITLKLVTQYYSEDIDTFGYLF